MGVALGWVAAALAAAGGGSPPEDQKPEITYRVRTVEVRGLAWRESGLKPVVQHNAVSVWTSPDDFLDRLPADAKAVAAEPVEAKGPALGPVHVTTRKNHDFVTQVVWKGKGKAPKPVTESVREGVAATIVGRALDQGVLAKVVIDDVDVRSVHTLGAPAPKPAASQARHSHEGGKPAVVTVSVTASMDADCEAKACDAKADAQACPLPSKAVAIVSQCQDQAKSACCDAEKPACCDESKAKTDDAARRTSFVPETPQVQIPEVGRGAAAGEWLIPDGEVLIVAFGPHTVADAEGKAVVREHLAVISAEVAEDATDAVATPPPPQAGIEPAFRPAGEARPEAPRTAAALPELPSRTLPQGIHADGTPAPLPTLPEDEAPATAADESAEPRPTPQTRRKAAETNRDDAKPEAEAPKADAAPKADRKTTRSSFKLPPIKGLEALQPLNALIGTSSLPIPFQGAQFLVPLKPLAVKLPFNQRLEFELIGRIVDDPQATEARFVVGN